MQIQVKTSHPSNALFTQDKLYDVAVKYDRDGKVRLARVLDDSGKYSLINLIGPCAYLDRKGEWEVIKCGG